MGTSVHFQTGVPINNLFRPSGLIRMRVRFRSARMTPRTVRPHAGPWAGRKNFGTVDYHMDYRFGSLKDRDSVWESTCSNITDNRTLLRVDQRRRPGSVLAMLTSRSHMAPVRPRSTETPTRLTCGRSMLGSARSSNF